MILKIACPSCHKAYRLTAPFPPPGKRYRCTCQQIITVTYPPELIKMLASSEESPEPGSAQPPAAHTPAGTAAEPIAVAPAADSGLEETTPLPTERPRLEALPPPAPRSSAPRLEAQSARPAPSPSAPDEPSDPRTPSAPDEPAAAGDPPLPDEPARPRSSRSAAHRRWPRLLLASLLLLLVIGAATLAGALYFYSRDLPSLEALRTYNPPIPSRVYAKDGRLIGEFHGEERRYVLPYDQIPKRVIDAFVAAEDSTFFTHHGIDYAGIARALLTNLREQRMAQGASTITQQVARSFLLTREKKIERKLVEALLASRIEKTFPKEHILYLYLNQIYLGEGAYGVQAAARTYFHKDVKDLSLAEIALLAGLPPAPSRYAPLDHFPEAKDRQRYVLSSMVRDGYITEAEAKAAEAEELELKPRADINKTVAPFVVEHVRRQLAGKYGDALVLEGGLEIHTTIDYDLQQAAQEAVRAGVREIDHRIGWRGPEKKLTDAELPDFLRRYEEELKLALQNARPGGVGRFGPPPPGPPQLEPGRTYTAVATEVKDDYALVRIGSQEGLLPLELARWGYSVNPARSWKYRELDRLTRVMKPGDVFTVKLERLDSPRAAKLIGDRKPRLELALEQDPAVEGSLFSYSPEDGSIIALVGGYDFNRSQFIRPFQAKRQVGSAFKPLVYAAALDHPEKVYTPATILLDAPITLVQGSGSADDPTNSNLWKPSNYDQDYLGEITLRRALYLSRNTVAVKVLTDIGVDFAYEYVKKLVPQADIVRDTSMVLGTSSLTLLEMCQAYSAFASGGYLVEPVLIERVVDRTGKVLEQRSAEPVKQQVMPASTAYIMTSMLQDVVRHGTATKALALVKPTAGKTGTTNDYVDASYIGYTPQIVTGTWVGYDQPRSMGLGQTGGDTALPMWVEYMKSALKVYPTTEPGVPEDVVFATVDADTGKLANDNTAKKVRLPFVTGEEPKEAAPEPGQVGTEDFLTADQAP